MDYNLRPGLSYCMIDGRPIFLDTDEDRYFRLAGSLEDAFRGYVNSDAGDRSSVNALVDRAILVPAPARDNRVSRVAPPARSSIELETGAGTGSFAAFPRVFMIVWRARRELAERPLKAVLDDLLRYRDKRRPDAGRPRVAEERVLEAANLFMRARLYVPINTCCLLDSIALATYLAGRGLPANMVFGVTDAPFSAHCWIQVNDLVLNDTVGNTMAYTPIRII